MRGFSACLFLFIVAGCSSYESSGIKVSRVDGGIEQVQGIYPGRPERYYALRSDGSMEVVYPKVFTPDRGEMVSAPFVLTFAPGSTEITPQGAAILETAAKRIASRRFSEVFIEGHTDSCGDGDVRRSGNFQFASELSTARAVAVSKWLQKRLPNQWKANTVLISGMGFAVPVVVGGVSRDQAPNRRVEVRIVFPASAQRAEDYGFHGQSVVQSNVQYAR